MADDDKREGAEDEAEGADEKRDDGPSTGGERGDEEPGSAGDDEEEDDVRPGKDAERRRSLPRDDEASRGKGRDRRTRQPEDEEEDDRDDADDDEPPPPRRKKGLPKPAREPDLKRRKRAEPERVVLPPEKDIGAPSRQTLLMLGVMASATLLMWGAARFACNAHPPQTRKPREVSTAELAREPKGAALELQQRWNSYDFKGALELAKGSIAEELKQAQAECDKDAAGCEAKRKAVRDQALATAVLLSRGPGSAKVRVVSRGGAGGNQTVVYTVEQEGSQWKVSGRAAEEPAPAPTPAGPAPSGSAAPAASGGP